MLNQVAAAAAAAAAAVSVAVAVAAEDERSFHLRWILERSASHRHANTEKLGCNLPRG